ncbi:extensin-like isoform X1 [Ostrinia furnacalis]|uniref:extensin-like isoform X1 n=1 Tax=Ostrinia furnacalis TaxID=93504 RepID=UPI001040A7B1|nr:extensin-like isoform X1 [Ostrinia furnacalis]
MGNNEPPACIQNAMMTKDKKPFTYTPGGLDLSQIRTPSMARRLARQRSLEDQEQAHAQYGGGNYHPQGGPGGPVPPPPPPPPSKIPAPPPPPPIVIDVPQSKSPKPVALGERPEIVIPENPIGMLRKTNSPYHWEAEKAELQRMGQVPKFQEKVPSPLTVKMPPSTFTQQQPQTYTPPGQNRQNYYGNHTPESPLHKPEAQYAHQKSNSPNVNGSPPMREVLQRQDSQFNKSPQPFASQSPFSNGSTYSPSPNNNWRQPEKRDSPLANVNNSPLSPQFQRGQYSPASQQHSPNYQNQSPSSNSGPQFHTLPRAGQRNQDNFVNNNQNNNVIYNNTREASPKVDPAPWRSNTLNRQPREPENVQNLYHNSPNVNQQPTYTPPWKSNDSNNNNDNSYIPPWKQENRNTSNQATNQQYTPPWVAAAQEANNNREQENYNAPWRSQNYERTGPASPPSRPSQPEQPRYQSTMSIPVTPKRQNPQPEYNNTPPQKEVVYVNQEPVYFCPDSPKSVPPWVKTQKEKTKTPPPVWVQRPLDGRRSIPRELATPPRDSNQEPEWVKKSNEMQRNAREVVSPPKYQQTAQPTWSTLPSENRKSVTRETGPSSQGNRVIPIQMEVSSTETRDGRQGHHQQPQLRIVIDMQQNPNAQNQNRSQVPFSPPTQRIMRVLSPQLVRLDDGPAQNELPSLNRNFQTSQDNQPKTRIIPIQIEGGGNGGANKRVYYHKFTQDGPPRQSKAFKVLQIITGTQDQDDIQTMEDHHGFTDL